MVQLAATNVFPLSILFLLPVLILWPPCTVLLLTAVLFYGGNNAINLLQCVVDPLGCGHYNSSAFDIATMVLFAIVVIVVIAILKELLVGAPMHTPSNEQQQQQQHPAKRLLRFLEQVPQQLKSGAWSPVAHLFIITFVGFLLMTLQHAIDSYQPHNYSIHSISATTTTTATVGALYQVLQQQQHWLQLYRLLGALYGFYILIDTVIVVGPWPVVSYTVTSWNLMTLRLLAAFIAGLNSNNSNSNSDNRGINYSNSNISNSNVWALLADALRFPALAGCSVTVFVWWLALVPLIHHLLNDSPHSQRFFWRWSTSFRLMNLHLLNLPLAAVEFIGSGQLLHFFDLWVALLVALLYVLFYLNVLDANGFHFYIILTPRTAWCLLSYGAVLCFYWLLHRAWNQLLLLQLL